MILNKSDFLNFLSFERKRNIGVELSFSQNIKERLIPGNTLLFLKYLRMCEYLTNVKSVPFRVIRLKYYKWLYLRLSVKLGFSIPLNCFDLGLYLPHYGGIIVNENVKIGRNCSIRPFTVIGNKRDGHNEEVPIIGHNVSIGCNVSIIGKVTVGDNVVIGAGTVVTKSVPSNSICIGNPMRILPNK